MALSSSLGQKNPGNSHTAVSPTPSQRPAHAPFSASSASSQGALDEEAGVRLSRASGKGGADHLPLAVGGHDAVLPRPLSRRSDHGVDSG